MSFVPLQVISEYSLLQSPLRVTSLVKAAHQRGYSAIALTDINVMYGLINFYHAAKKEGIKPLLGLQIALGIGDLDGNQLHLLLLAKNNAGYQALMRLSTKQQTLSERAQLTFDDIQSLLHNLFIILPPQKMLQKLGNPDVSQLVNQLKGNADPDALQFGVSANADSVQQRTWHNLANQFGAPEVAIDPVEYLNPDDAFAARVLRAIGTGNQITNLAAAAQEEGTRFLKTAAQEQAAFAGVGLKAAADQTVKIADACDVALKFQPPVLPHFKTPEGISSGEYLRSLCTAGLQKRPLAEGLTEADYQKRLDRELTTIHQMGFDDYFLIVWDVMNFAHRVKITTGPGRGSAAGSLVAYCLAITDVDPLQYHLLFERFLNPERQQMPDIDLDIPDVRRGEILKYVHDKYGHDHVGQIITFGTLAAKQVVRDVSRVFRLSNFETTSLASAIPGGPGVTLRGAMKSSQRLVNLLHDSDKSRLLLQVALKLEGLPRHYSTHAAGIVLSDHPLVETVPLQMGSDGMLMTQYEKGTVEEVGLLKMDFLGLKNLTIMDHAVNLVRRQRPHFDVSQISLDDPATLRLFQKGRTGGVFQFESAGIRRVLVELHPDNFELIVAVNALYRPGPMDNISHFIARKKGREPITYPDPSLKPILKPTYGILVYQEQVMQSASAMAGFSLGQADLLRRAMSKKKQSVMESMRAKFLAGAQKNGHSEAVASQVFDYIDRFANYGFNRSHAVAYSKMAFEMAYLKCHFPAEFFTALMNSETNVDKLRRHFDEARAAGVRISGPNINESQLDYSLNKSGVLCCGFRMIKGFRGDFARDIIKERQANGRFSDLRNFISRMNVKWRKAELIEPLIDVGAFDGLGFNRREMVEALPDLVNGAQLSQGLDLLKDDPAFQTVIKHRQEYSLAERLSREYDYLGLYLSGHPTTAYSATAKRVGTTTVDQLRPGRHVTLCLFIGRVKQIYTKRDHRPMAFADATDRTGQVEMTIFPKAYAQFGHLFQTHTVLFVTGSVEQRSGRGLGLLVDRAMAASDVRNHYLPARGQWFLRIDEEHDRPNVLSQLVACFRQYHGQQPVLIVYTKGDRKIMQPPSRYLATGQKTKQALVAILGQQNVVFTNRH